MKLANIFSLGLVLTLAPCSLTQTRKSSWQVFAPAGRGFRIEVPSKPHPIKNEYGDIDPKGYKAIYVYGPKKSVSFKQAYEIIVLVPSLAMRKQNGGANKLGGLEFTIGGDDAEPARESPVKVNGLDAKEFIYHSPDAETLGHRKGRIIDARTKIFILIYATNTASGLDSPSATRFFNSFEIT